MTISRLFILSVAIVSNYRHIVTANTTATFFHPQPSSSSNSSVFHQRRHLEKTPLYWTFTSPCTYGSFVSYVSSSIGFDNSITNGASPMTPYRTIQYAIDERRPCQTIYVMSGVYRNRHFGTNSSHRPPVGKLTNVADLKIGNYQNDTVLIEFDGSGGFIGHSVSNIEIYGMEIKGPNLAISYPEALSHREDVNSSDHYRSRGIALWGGHHVHIHSMTVHHCPGSGIRVNRGDYVSISDNVVYSNTWWSSAAESAVVFAESRNIDQWNTIKMTMTNNVVYDNVNKIPYFNKNYEWSHSPIGRTDCKNYPACAAHLVSDCPWVCRYGKPTQNYIIDGSGLYVTRSSATYRRGITEIADNIAYGNGIAGIVFHRADRALIRRNLIYDNGVVPRKKRVRRHEGDEGVDWHEGCKGRPRQPLSGIVLNEAGGVKLWGNRVAARYDDDYAFKQNGRVTEALEKGGNNKVCRGLVDLEPKEAVVMVKNWRFCYPEQPLA